MAGKIAARKKSREPSPSRSTSADLAKRAVGHLWVQNALPERIADPDLGVLFLESGDGVWLQDVDGRRFLDALSGIYTVALGYGRRELIDAAVAQMERLPFFNPIGAGSEPTVALAEKLADIAPGDVDRAYFVSSGSEAVDMALRIARNWHYNRGERKRHKVIARMGSYHGHTFGSLSLNFAPHSAKARPAQEPMAPGSIAVPGVNCAHCPYEKTYPECDVFCARAIEQFIDVERPETIAAIVVEPISTSSGGFIPPKEYFPTIRKICDRHGILLVADEVTNGIGRTGRWFAIEHFGVVPDLIAVAKGLASGYMPIGAVLARPRIYEEFRGAPEKMFISAHTFGGHPVASAVALETLSIIEREGLLENSRKMGERLAGGLRALAKKRRHVGEVWGLGLEVSLQLAADRGSRAPLPPADCRRLAIALRKRGLLCRVIDRIDFAPPLVIGAAEIDRIVEIVDQALGDLEG